ncbi:hypothetical protein FJ364_02500 [Candidatus Dependentiae bacterium]|nr:hypothetical protein [Candidatus Dependentiae bacterium]
MRITAKNILRLLIFFISVTHLLQAVAIQKEITQKSIIGNILHISAPGEYIVTENIHLGSVLFLIDANDVSIDLQGNTIDFSRENRYGISFMAGCTGITIKNGTIRHASAVEAISLTQNSNITLSNLDISTAGTTALLIHACSDVNLKKLEFSGTMLQTGVQIEQCLNIFVENCLMQNIYAKNFRGFSIQQSQIVVCKNNTINNVQTVNIFRGFVVQKSSRVCLTKNTITMNTGQVCIGISLAANRHNKITNNEISMNITKANQKHLRSIEGLELEKTEVNTKDEPLHSQGSDSTAKTQPSKDIVFDDNFYSGNIESLFLDDPILEMDPTNRGNYQIKHGTFIGINVGSTEQFANIAHNTIKDNIGRHAAYGIRIHYYVPSKTESSRTLHIEKNEIRTNIGTNYQYGIMDQDDPSNNAYIQNKVLFHGKSLEGSSMPTSPEKKANYFMRKNCQITNLIKEAPVDDINFFTDDLNNKNLSIY